MKLYNFFSMAACAAAMTLTSCRTMNGAYGENAQNDISTLLSSTVEYDLDVSTEPITYSIDISTELGAAKLKNLTIKQAEDLAKREAIMKYKCGTLVNPQYTYLKKGNRILRITVYGFPAMYKNQEKQPYDAKTRQEIDINIR